jgi:L-threonylcarbamoyladenylate synthase
MKYTHYKPLADVFLYRDPAELRQALQRHWGKKIGILTLGPAPESETASPPKNREQLVAIREMASLQSYARRLYAEFFVFDTLGCDIVLAAYPEEKGLGRAIRNRLLKAAGGCFIDAADYR